MSIHVRPAGLRDGVAVLSLLESVGQFPEPIGFAETYRKTLHDPRFLVRVAEDDSGRVVGVAALSLRYQLGAGGLVASLDELAIAPGPEAARADRALQRATLGKARSLGARRVIRHGAPPPVTAAAGPEALPRTA